MGVTHADPSRRSVRCFAAGSSVHTPLIALPARSTDPADTPPFIIWSRGIFGLGVTGESSHPACPVNRRCSGREVEVVAEEKQ